MVLVLELVLEPEEELEEELVLEELEALELFEPLVEVPDAVAELVSVLLESLLVDWITFNVETSA